MFAKAKSFAAALVVGIALFGLAPEASAQEVQVSGPLAGAPAVKNLRLYRKGRFELSPNISFTLLDEYRRQMVLGLRLNYGITDWLAIGAWGGISSSLASLHLDTDLTNQIQSVNEGRNCAANASDLNCRLTAVNLGEQFQDQVASLNWFAAPQVTAVPFRGKLGLFNDIFVDAELYVFGGAAFIGVRERADCAVGACGRTREFEMADRVAIAPTFGLGFTFFTNKWTAVGAEYRALPFSWNPGGFDTAGRGRDNAFPDGAVTGADQQFKFNQMLTLSFNMYLPTAYKVSE